MFEAGIEVCLSSQLCNFVEVGMVNMRINAEKSLEDVLHNFVKVLWKWNSCFEKY
jgi:hypothetical protein